MATFYIDPTVQSGGDGSIGSPFSSWSSVTWAAGNNYYQKAGTTFYGGIVVGASGTAANRIAVGKYGSGADPIVTNTSGVGLQSAGQNFITISNFRATGCSSHGMNLRGSNCAFSDLESDNNGGSGVNFNMGASWSDTVYTRINAHDNVDHAIGAAGNTGGITIERIRFVDCIGSGSSGSVKHGLYMEFISGATGSNLKSIYVDGGSFDNNSGAGINIRNSVDSFPGSSSLYNQDVNIEFVSAASNGTCGISILGCAGGKITFCRVFENGDVGTLGGIWTGRNSGLLVAWNESIGNKSSGIDGAGIFDDQYNDKCKFIGNFVYNNRGNIQSQPYYSGYGIAVYGATNSLHQGNVVIGNTHGIWISNPVSPTTENCVVVNNTFIENIVSGVNYDYDLGDSKAVIENNVVVGSVHGIYKPGGSNSFSETTNCCFNNETNFSGISAGVGSIEIDPRIDSRFLVTNPLLIGAGKSLGGRDFYGGAFHNIPNFGAVQNYENRLQLARNVTARSIDERRIRSRIPIAGV